MTKSKSLVHKVRIGQFVSVGATGATLETIIVAILTTTVGFTPLAAKAVGAEAAISLMFVVNDRWTFAGQGATGLEPFLRRWMKSHLVRGVGLLVAFSVLYALTGPLEISVLVVGVDLWPTIANVIGIGCGMVINYIAESMLTWQIHK